MTLIQQNYQQNNFDVDVLVESERRRSAEIANVASAASASVAHAQAETLAMQQQAQQALAQQQASFAQHADALTSEYNAVLHQQRRSRAGGSAKERRCPKRGSRQKAVRNGVAYSADPA